MYSVLGFLNIALLIIILLPLCLRFLGKWVPSIAGSLKKPRAFFRKTHKFAAVLLVISIIAHGYLALGGFYLHTGTILGAILVITMIFGLLFHLTKKPIFFKLHKLSALLAVLSLLVHLFLRNII